MTKLWPNRTATGFNQSIIALAKLPLRLTTICQITDNKKTHATKHPTTHRRFLLFDKVGLLELSRPVQKHSYELLHQEVYSWQKGWH